MQVCMSLSSSEDASVFITLLPSSSSSSSSSSPSFTRFTLTSGCRPNPSATLNITADLRPSARRRPAASTAITQRRNLHTPRPLTPPSPSACSSLLTSDLRTSAPHTRSCSTAFCQARAHTCLRRPSTHPASTPLALTRRITSCSRERTRPSACCSCLLRSWERERETLAY